MKLLGPPPVSILAATAAGAVGSYGLFVVPADEYVLAAGLMIGAVVLLWRFMSHSVAVRRGEVVVRNLLRTHRIPAENASISIRGVESGRASVWVHNLTGSRKPVRVGCLLGRRRPKVRGAGSLLDKAIEQANYEASVDYAEVLHLDAIGAASRPSAKAA